MPDSLVLKSHRVHFHNTTMSAIQVDTVTAEDFLSDLKDRIDAHWNFSNRHTIVMGGVVINPQSIGLPAKKPASARSGGTAVKRKKPQIIEAKTIGFENITFLGSVSFEDMESVLLRFNSVNFHDGFTFTDFVGGWISIQDCRLNYLTFYSSTCTTIDLCSIQGLRTTGRGGSNMNTRSIDISGLEVTERADFENLSVDELITVGHRRFKAPLVSLEDPVLALQFQLAGTPVHVRTEVARMMIARSRPLK